MGLKRKISSVLKNNRFVYYLYWFFGSAFFKILSPFIKVDKKQIMFSCMSGDYFSGSPKVIYERIKKEYGDDYKYCWAFTHPDDHPECTEPKIKIDGFKYVIKAMKCGIWITDTNIERGLSFKRKKNYYVNTWHGTAGKKAKNFRKDLRFNKVDLICCDGPLTLMVFKRDFHLTREDNILYCGRPREDELYVDVEEKTKFYKKKFEFENKQVILFAPTFRENETSFENNEHLLYGLDVEKIIKSLGENYVFIYRGHHFSTIDLKNYSYIFDGTKIDNVNELFFASDILITDYSSILFDFLILERPTICFAPDYEEYNKQRGISYDLKNEFPEGICKTTEEVIDKIKNIHSNDYQKKLDEFFNSKVQRTANSCEQIIERMKKDGVLLFK